MKKYILALFIILLILAAIFVAYLFEDAKIKSDYKNAFDNCRKEGGAPNQIDRGVIAGCKNSGGCFTVFLNSCQPPSSLSFLKFIQNKLSGRNLACLDAATPVCLAPPE